MGGLLYDDNATVSTRNVFVSNAATSLNDFSRLPFILTIAISTLLFLALNSKNLPLAWHFRITNAFSYVLRSQRVFQTSGTPHVFDAVVTNSLSPLMEMDFNLHKSNSTYYSDVDIARTNLICTLFNRGIEHARFTSPAKSKARDDAPLSAMLASASCIFKQQIMPYERYAMWSRILCWDHKWFWVVTWFVEPREKMAQHKGVLQQPKVFATAVSKCVFKKDRVTIQPDVMMNDSGLLQAHAPGNATSDGNDKIWDAESLRQIEHQRQSGLELLSSHDGLEKLHVSFGVNDRILAERNVLDFSPLLILRIAVLFGEWIVDRLWRMMRKARKIVPSSFM